MNNKNNDYQYLKFEDFVRFTEFPLAVALLCKDFKLEAFDRDPKNSPQIIFLFPKSDEILKTISVFWNGGLLVDAKEFWQKSRELKARMKMESSTVNYGAERE